MEEIGFFTSVTFDPPESWKHRVFQFSDECFSFGSKVAVISNQTIEVKEKNSNFMMLVVKIVVLTGLIFPTLLLFTQTPLLAVILPFSISGILLTVKIIFRSSYDFSLFREQRDREGTPASSQKEASGSAHEHSSKPLDVEQYLDHTPASSQKEASGRADDHFLNPSDVQQDLVRTLSPSQSEHSSSQNDENNNSSLEDWQIIKDQLWPPSPSDSPNSKNYVNYSEQTGTYNSPMKNSVFTRNIH